ncbi:putative transposon-related (plasmid) [Sinorhizobium fredii HH103]|uniref:Uncharacterized protein n=1 Tax=Sinorhizobium fredii (strain USDA 257) TaxID=1185652 RepID=I3XH47_SINF2|nr:hypothetical protein USDA257_p04880 [Sinorhizobium fredii USDA 257]CCE99293.1 hypothetical protein SFHH103_04826 [Sinorhizobium fredii HH103]CEO91660.1 putative transposon-related [Sinorhizobium fredii HH103]
MHATTLRVVNEAFAEERSHLRPLPLARFRSVLKLERRISRDGMVMTLLQRLWLGRPADERRP